MKKSYYLEFIMGKNASWKNHFFLYFIHDFIREMDLCAASPPGPTADKYKTKEINKSKLKIRFVFCRSCR